jgi:hypothetical protein
MTINIVHLPETIASLPISALLLPGRVQNALSRANIASIGVLDGLATERLLLIRGMGVSSINIIRSALTMFKECVQMDGTVDWPNTGRNLYTD